jgi:hypothetical protein
MGDDVGYWNINITGTSVNPARSIGPALIGMNSNAGAVAQLWLFIIAPLSARGWQACSTAKARSWTRRPRAEKSGGRVAYCGRREARDGTAEAREAAAPYNSVVGQSWGSPTTSTAPRELDQGAAEWGGNA